MLLKNINKSSGQIARTLLALAVIVLIALAIVYIVVSITKPKPPSQPVTPGEPNPVYEATIGDIRFLFLEATDMGSVLRGRNSRSPDWQKDLESTERFIEVTIGAQNIGKENTKDRIWEIGNIIDSEGRNYIPSGQEVSSWLPQYQDDLCGSILKPSFEPSSCKKIYEVAKVATGLKIQVIVSKESYSEGKNAALLDIKLMP